MMVYIEFYFIRQVKVYIVYKIPYRRAPRLAECVARAKVSCIQKKTELCRYHKISIKLSLCGEFNGLCVMQFVRLNTGYHARHESGGLIARVSSSTAVYEARLTTS